MPRKSSRFYRPEVASLSIPEKANKVLHLILMALFLITLRVWHLAVIQSDAKEAEAKRPQHRVVVEPAKRGTIRDRYNVPLAINKIHYQAAIVYSQLRDIKSVEWKTDAQGNKIKIAKRKEYITQLSELLSRELGLDPARIEDLIYSKASFQSHVPFVIKEDLSEKEYYRLKMLEKDWVGIQATQAPKRFYPQGRVGADIIGYMGAINKREYDAILTQMRSLEDYVRALDAGEEDPFAPEGIRSPEEARVKLRDLKEKAYTINDHVGKVGVEATYERLLRGFHGKKQYFSDAKGNYLRELPGAREPLSGQRLLLTISSELQEYAEKLLMQNEEIRKARLSNNKGARITLADDKQPWIKGGAILAMDPQTGDILAMASHPRYDPNDFTSSGNPEQARIKQANIARWFESENYVAEVWDQKRPLERELLDPETEEPYDDQLWLSWEVYINAVLSKDSPIRAAIKQVNTLDKAVDLQETIQDLLRLTGLENIYMLFNLLYPLEPHIVYGPKATTQKENALQQLEHAPRAAVLKRKLDSYVGGLTHQYDKVLLADLVQLAVAADRFTPSLLQIVGSQSLETYRKACAAQSVLLTLIQGEARDLFRKTEFKEWRSQNEKTFLKEKRQLELLTKKSPKPYIDYLDAKETELFKEFWNQEALNSLIVFLKGSEFAKDIPLHKYLQAWHGEIRQGAYSQADWRPAYNHLIEASRHLSQEQTKAYLATLRSYQDLTRPLFGRYRHLRRDEGIQKEKHLAAAFYPLNGYGYGRSQVYRQAATQGSIFKLVTAYEALVQRFRRMKEMGFDRFTLNPLEMTDTVFKVGKDLFVGYSIDGKPIARHYKGGRLPRTAMQAAGRLDIVKAIEVSSNVYFALLAGDILDDPNDLVDAARMFSFGAKTGIDLPGEISGNVPNDLDVNRTGLYSTAIGQHTLVVTPLQTGVMLSALANGGRVLKPKILHMTAGRQPDRGEDLLHCPPKFCYQEYLELCGIDFPLFTAVGLQDQKSLVKHYPPELKREVDVPDEVRQTIMEGMRRVVVRTQAESLGALSNVYRNHPEAISDYVELKEQLLGKTSTAESMERIDLDLEKGVNMFLHVWFGGIAYEEPIKNAFVSKDALGNPELVVVVYLRYGGYGKEAAPIAAQVVKKWREIKALHSR